MVIEWMFLLVYLYIFFDGFWLLRFFWEEILFIKFVIEKFVFLDEKLFWVLGCFEFKIGNLSIEDGDVRDDV